MNMSRVALMVAASVAVALACSAPDPPQFGGPGSLQNIAPPQRPAGGGPGGGEACTVDKRLPIDPACTVKWSTDIFPKMASGTPWNCASSTCHAAGAKPPLIDADADATYERLTKWTTVAKPYFNPCSKDVAASAFACNTKATEPVCDDAMPLGAGVPAGDKATITTWVACGSPKN